MNINRLPIFPNKEQIDLKHKELLISYFKNIQPVISELNFAEMFAWRKIRKICISNYQNKIILFLEKKGNKYFYPPFYDKMEQIIIDIFNFYKSRNEEIKINAFPEEKLSPLNNIKNLLLFEDSRDNYDYIYLSKDLINLAGRKFHNKRNNIQNFYKYYNFEFKEITHDMIPYIIEFQKKWCELKKCKDDMSLKNENEATMEILLNFKDLPVFGGAILINNKIEAYSIGSELNDLTGEVIIEKANPEYKGIYQTINKLFCEKFFKKYEFINRQQDTGDPGLRKAKLSYHPYKLLKKFNIGLKNGTDKN